MKKKYTVRLTPEERIELEKLVSAGETKARKLMHAHILLEADADGPNWADAQIHEALGAGTATIERVRKTFVEGGLPGSLNRNVNTGMKCPQIIGLKCPLFTGENVHRNSLTFVQYPTKPSTSSSTRRSTANRCWPWPPATTSARNATC